MIWRDLISRMYAFDREERGGGCLSWLLGILIAFAAWLVVICWEKIL